MRVSPTRINGPRRLFGRNADFAELDDAWTGRRIRVVTIVAWGGVGKTALVHAWRSRLCERDDRPELVFDWSFASQGVRERGAVSADSFLREALCFFGEVEYADSSASSLEKGTRLAAVVGERRALLILDGIEPLQAPPHAMGASCPLREGSVANLLRCLAQHNHGLCVVTTREALHDLEGFESTTARRQDLAHLSPEHGAELLHSLLTDGERPTPVASTAAERMAISVAVAGHALTLQLLGIYIRRALGDVRRWQEIDFGQADEAQGGHAFRVMEAYVRWLSGSEPAPMGWFSRAIAWFGRASMPSRTRGQQQIAALRLLGFFDRPADPGSIAALLARPAITGVTDALVGLDAQGWAALTASVEELRLLMRSEHEAWAVWGHDEAAAEQAGRKGWPTGPPKKHLSPDPDPQAQTLDAHPLVRKFFARELRRTNEAGWREGHRRLYVHLCGAVPYWPEGIEGLAPLYQAVVHGCEAGLMQDVCTRIYHARILRGERAYSTKQLGAISADLATIACFFEHIWDKPSTALTEADQAWVLNEAAFSLRALGRLRDALGPMRAGLDRTAQRKSWVNAAIAASNLSELELLLGRTSAAVEDAAQSVDFADRSENDGVRMVQRTTLADALHQTGDHAGAHALFEEAEAMQAMQESAEPQFYSLRGHQYCDLLLSPAERQAWSAAPGDPESAERWVTLCQKVFDRATRALEAARRHHLSLLDIALHHLTLGRAAFYAATLLAQRSARTPPAELSFAAAHRYLNTAVDGLRAAGQVDHLPRGLLARACLRHRDRPDLATADLDAAWALAERGPMPLFQADIELTRARLFRDRAALEHARGLITRHGYGRRREELADAEQAALTWPAPELQPPPDAKPSPRITTMHAPPWDPTLRPDIAFLIALPEEFRVLAGDLADKWYSRPNPRFHGSDFLFVGEGGYRCTATILPRMGTTPASQVSMRLLDLRPAVIVNLGIAGGFKSRDLRIGDVIVPRQVDAYDETGKVEGIHWQRRGSAYRPSPGLVEMVHQLEFTTRDEHARWAKDGADHLARLRQGPDQERIAKLVQTSLLRDRPIVSTYHLASGSFVVASKPFATWIREANADIHAGEMEAAGMMAAAEYQRDPVETLVVRGISDHVDADKSEVDAAGDGALRRLAMENAWRLVCTLMRQGLLPRANAPAGTAPPPSVAQARTSTSPPSAAVLAIWWKKLDYLLAQEPTTTDPDAKFRLHGLIEEARAKIREYGGEA